MKNIKLSLFIILIVISINAFPQTLDETIEYINNRIIDQINSVDKISVTNEGFIFAEGKFKSLTTKQLYSIEYYAIPDKIILSSDQTNWYIEPKEGQYRIKTIEKPSNIDTGCEKGLSSFFKFQITAISDLEKTAFINAINHLILLADKKYRIYEKNLKNNDPFLK